MHISYILAKHTHPLSIMKQCAKVLLGPQPILGEIEDLVSSLIESIKQCYVIMSNSSVSCFQ